MREIKHGQDTWLVKSGFRDLQTSEVVVGGKALERVYCVALEEKRPEVCVFFETAEAAEPFVIAKQFIVELWRAI
jgi:hypothetical protein